MGLLAAFLVRGKILMQEEEKEKEKRKRLGRSSRVRRESILVDMVQPVRRPTKHSDSRHVWAEVGEENMELHLFADASQRAMAAVAYLKCQQNNEANIFLLMSKTQVAPLKKMSIPRLELQACLLSVRLAELIKKEMDFKYIKVIFWSDSAVALSWIKMHGKSTTKGIRG